MASPHLPTVPLFIAGCKRSSSSGATYDVHNPANGQVIANAAAATAQDCKEAIEAAEKAFGAWQFATPGQKSVLFKKAAELVVSDSYKDKIMKAITEETGCTASWGKLINVDLCHNVLHEACEMAYQVKGEILPSDSGAQSFVQRLPMGVVFVISPWNAPLGLSLMTVLPPIAAGNTVVLKTSEYSPSGQLIAAELLKEAGLPDGVLNIIHTAREDSGPRVAEIIAHPAVRKIAFTGSDRVGSIIAAEAAKYLKPCVFELGGKAPAVVLNGANVEAASRAIVSGAMNHSGQMCISTERVIVQRDIAQQLIDNVKAVTSKIKAGDQSKTDAKLSCVFNPSSAANIISMIQEAVADGAELLVGDLKAQGAFVQPHIVLGAKPGQRLWDRESFGPDFTSKAWGKLFFFGL
ncbi:hypothetical protein PHLCEN_2v5006 [Hermanssonia centrifuga]|uniref:Aldehyde dehydrogenase domain-containing protein n=1 Tax=Hermanssonia centrifuga TaxID=98765 RepID=A0A2R6PC68_9APHY|nr:hypothetical protein PHLCEN_2v5006 [Hermanssonia centrifuga]